MSSSHPLRRAAVLAAGAAVLLAACAGPYAMSQAIDPALGLSVGEGVRLAARAMQAAGYFPTRQSEAQGQVAGERQDKDSFGADVFTLTIEATVRAAPTGGLQVNSVCSVSKNIVYTDQLDDECEKFRRAFDKLLAERAVARRPAAPAPGVQPTRPPPPVAPAPPTEGKPKGYTL